MKENIAELCKKVVVTLVDYLENFKNKQQNEIKAIYSGQDQFSLFTVVVWVKKRDNVVCKQFALVTPENDHSCNISFGLNIFMISQI